MRAKSIDDREHLTAEQWRTRARHLREFALNIADERTCCRMEQQAREYERRAAIADVGGTAATAPAKAAPDVQGRDGT